MGRLLPVLHRTAGNRLDRIAWATRAAPIPRIGGALIATGADLFEAQLCQIARILQPAGRFPRLEREAQPDIDAVFEENACLNDVGAKDTRKIRTLFPSSICQQCENWTGSTTIALPGAEAVS